MGVSPVVAVYQTGHVLVLEITTIIGISPGSSLIGHKYSYIYCTVFEAGVNVVIQITDMNGQTHKNWQPSSIKPYRLRQISTVCIIIHCILWILVLLSDLESICFAMFFSITNWQIVLFCKWLLELHNVNLLSWIKWNLFVVLHSSKAAYFTYKSCTQITTQFARTFLKLPINLSDLWSVSWPLQGILGIVVINMLWLCPV